MLRRTRFLAVVPAIALLVGGLSACSSDSNSNGAKASSTLTLGVILPPHSFAAAEANWSNESPYMQAVYDTLLQAKSDGSIQPGLATKYSWNTDKTVLTLTLRDGVTFSDGTKFDADVAVQNLERFKRGTSTNASYLAGMTSAKAVSASSVEITLAAPDPALLTYLTQNAGLQESPKAFSKSDVATVPVGSGPYLLDQKDTVPSSSYVFTKNPKYWNKSQQHYDKLVLNVYGNQTTVLNAIRAGQVDASTLFDVSSNDQIKAAGFSLSPELSETWAGLVLADRNGKFTKALGDVRVRQAINYALDRPALLKTIIKGVGVTTTQVFPQASPGFDKALDSRYPYDPAKAKQLLSDAGYPNGFTLKMPTINEVPASTYALIDSQLKAVGITVQDTKYPIGQIFNAVLAPKYSVFYFQLQEDPNDYQLANFSLAASATWNPFKVADSKVTDLIKTIQTGSAGDAGTASKALNQYIVENAWFAPFYRPTFSYASNPKTVKITMQVGGAAPQLWNFVPVS